MTSNPVLGAFALATATAAPAPAHGTSAHDEQGGGRTTVVLNPALVPTLVDTLKVEALAPGRLSEPGGDGAGVVPDD
jgi:hypothetical protein